MENNEEKTKLNIINISNIIEDLYLKEKPASCAIKINYDEFIELIDRERKSNNINI